MLLTTPALNAHYDRAGNRILYEDLKGYEDPWRKHETFSVARDIWLYDAKSGDHKKISSFQGENRNPVWSPDESAVYYLTEQSGSFNVWRISLLNGQPGTAQQVTGFEKNPVRFLSAANNGDLCFGYDGEIYTLPAGARQPQKVDVHIGLSDSEPATRIRHYSDNVTDMAHFFYIHFGLPTYFKNVFEGHVASQYLHNVGRPDVNDLGTSYGEAHLDSEASYFGPSFMINWLHNKYGDYKAESILINCHYPVTQDSFVLQWGVIVEKPKGMDEAMTEKLSRVFTEGVSKGFLQDVEIWRHKTRIDNPLLVEEDGAVYQMRRWYQQFYVDVAEVTPDMTDRFEIEVDTTVANEKWHVEVEENLKRQSESEGQPTQV